MLIYWLLFFYFAVGALSSVGASADARGRRAGWLFFFSFALIVIVIGLRYKVGADWDSYVGMYAETARFSLSRLVKFGDPGYQVLNWLAYQIGGDVWVVNTLCALIFSWGLYRFCMAQPSPWLAAIVAIPYLVIVVAMGYSRQGVALGVLMAGLARVTRGGSTIAFTPYVAVAATFHSTAVVMFPLVAVGSKRNRMINLALVIFGTYFLYDMFLGNSMDRFMSQYIHTRYSSQGALIRIGMNAIAAMVFWTSWRKLDFLPEERAIWRNFSLAAVALLLLFFVFPSSTALDRVSLYIIPLQIAVLARFAYISKNGMAGSVGVIAYLMTVQFVWLNFAQHARYWLPYRFFPL